eukprot:CAMPEP_0119035106 /NCGR_PEP_ID=MMETSP1177-20130426/2073_1 /TAXON_ID=2985 /ORGANISM="Ochromonas sp, Strain CCMP1899" /LENGTH=53 /DNA_ID=CAMNT_0006993025 /DNA_START=238 /DNA_END=399 /DNA_ORIENTATION=+
MTKGVDVRIMGIIVLSLNLTVSVIKIGMVPVVSHYLKDQIAVVMIQKVQYYGM